MSTLTLAICARNAQDIIGDCLESIRLQTAPPDEVIVALDDLSDPTKAVAEKFGARVLASNATGLYEARNAVLDACTTDYLAFTDADCVLVPEWVERAKAVFEDRPDVAAGTGRHPPIGEQTFASWLHHMWFVVETQDTGYTDGVIGGNSYFRSEALRRVGGWLKLPRHSAAEDVYISIALAKAGYRIWFEEGCAAQHHYETDFRGLMRKSEVMGRDIVVMMRAVGWREEMWWYTMFVLVAAFMVINGVLFSLLQINPWVGAVMTLSPLAATFLFLWRRFGSLSAAAPRWVARWVVIWPYAWGIVGGLLARVPDEARR